MIDLHLHSTYSYLDSFGLAPQILERAEQLGRKAIALTDHDGVWGIPFLEKYNKNGIKLLYGAEMRMIEKISDLKESRTKNHITMIAKNQQGWAKLCNLITRSYDEDHFYYYPTLDIKMLEEGAGDLVIMSGCMSSLVSRFLLDNDLDKAMDIARKFKDLYGKDYYLEIIPIENFPDSVSILATGLKKISKSLDIPIVLTHDVHQLHEGQTDIWKMLHCIRQRKTMEEIEKQTFATDCYQMEDESAYQSSLKTLGEIFSKEEIMEMFHNQERIVADCESYKLKKGMIVKFKNAREILEKKAWEGLASRGLTSQVYKDRLSYELDLITQKDFCDYFLIVSDLTSWAKRTGYLVGSGRGCFLPGSKVQIINGKNRNIEDVEIGTYVLTCGSNYRKVLDKYSYDVQEECIRVILDNNKVIECTLDHQILTIDGFVAADKLIVGQKLECPKRKAFEKYEEPAVKTIDKFFYKGKVYDLNVEDDHTYTISGVGVHNSAAGGLICYVLRITEVDPIFHDIMFERFISVDRMDPPDIDIDFQSSARQDVLHYLYTKYGRDRAAQIGAFSTFGGKNTLDEVGKMYRVPKFEVESLKDKLITRIGVELRASFTIMDTIEGFNDAKKIVERYPALLNAVKLEGQIRHFGAQAAGAVVNSFPLNYITPLMERDEKHMVFFDGEISKYLNILKIDTLGINALDKINTTLDAIGQDYDWLSKASYEDEKTFQLFNDVDVKGIFQYEKNTGPSLLRQIHIDNFEDLVALNALARPGPLHSGATQIYTRAKAENNPNAWSNEIMDKITERTHGVIIYQEQTLSACRFLGHMEWEDISHVRTIMSKSMGKDYFEKYRNLFVDGAINKSGVTDEFANHVFDHICVFWNTKILCKEGTKAIEKNIVDIKVGDWVASLDRNFSLVYNPVSRIYENSAIHLMNVVFDNGVNIKCTPSHPFFVIKGLFHGVTNQWVKAMDLSIGDECIGWTDNDDLANVIIKQADFSTLKDWQKVYNLEVEFTHNYFANGINIGNCTHGCLSYDTMITMDYGKRMRIGDLYRKWTPADEVNILSLDNNGDKLIENKVLNVVYSGDKEVFSVKTNQYDIEATAEHMFLTPNGWKKLSELRSGRTVCINDFDDTVKWIQVQSIDSVGVKDTYDITMQSPHNSFVANNFIVHNSWSFNRGHSVSYTDISYKMAYLKAHYPRHFYYGLLMNEDVEEKVNGYLRDYIEKGYGRVLPPKLNHSDLRWKLEGNDLRAGLTQVKGLGEKAAEQLISLYPIKDMEDLKKRVTKRVVNIRVIRLIEEYKMLTDEEDVDVFGLYDFADRMKNIERSHRMGDITYQFKTRPVLLAGFIPMQINQKNLSELEVSVVLKDYSRYNRANGDEFAIFYLRDETGQLQCFPSGTKVLTRISDKKIGQSKISSLSIEKIKVGDTVLSYNESTGEKELDKVVALNCRDAEEWMKIEFSNGNKLDCTLEHPIYIHGKGWIPAKDLMLGDVAVQKEYHGLKLRLDNFGRQGKSNEEIHGSEKAKIIRSKHIDDSLKNNIIERLCTEKALQSRRDSDKCSSAALSSRFKNMWSDQNFYDGMVLYRRQYAKDNYDKMIKQAKLMRKACVDDPIKEIERIRKVRIAWHKWNDSLTFEERQALNAKMAKTQIKSNRKINKSERIISRILGRVATGEYKFNGGGKYLLVDGSKRPDFVNIDKKKIVDFRGCYYHCCEQCYDHNDFMKGIPKQDVRDKDVCRDWIYAMLGWDVCVIWEHELKDLEKLKKKLLDFHYNPSSYTVEITKIEKYSKKDKAYNIQTEKNHNYFAYGILVHNCIVDNKLYPKVKDLLWSCKIGSDIIRIKGTIPPSKMFVNLQEVEKYDDTKYSGSKCYKCPLAKNDFVPPFGSKTSSIMIIGEAPGKIEVERGQPFVGRSGSLLGDILAELGLDRSHLYISNSVFCHPVDGNKNRTPTDEEINCCRGHLEWEIDEIKPKVVITMGKVPLAAMLNKKVEEIKISKMVESVIDLETLSSKYKGVLLIPSYHPVAALYSPDSGYRDSIKNSIQLALDETNKQISKINRLKVSREKRENSGLIRSENNREN